MNNAEHSRGKSENFIFEIEWEPCNMSPHYNLLPAVKVYGHHRRVGSRMLATGVYVFICDFCSVGSRVEQTHVIESSTTPVWNKVYEVNMSSTIFAHLYENLSTLMAFNPVFLVKNCSSGFFSFPKCKHFGSPGIKYAG